MKTIFLSLLLLSLQLPCFSATFHAIIVADTAEQKIQHSSRIDIQRMEKAIRKMARLSGTKLSLTILRGNNVTLPKLKSWYETKIINSHDILFFYFTGHGFALPSQHTIWPNLFFKPKKEAISMENIHQALEKKRARLTLVFSDSCNRFGPVLPNFAYNAVKKQKKIPISFKAKKKGIRKLFRHKRGKILASGAIRGTPSFGSDHGGFFTQAFLLALQDESRRRKPSWNRVFQKAKHLLKYSQKPQYKLYLK